MVTVELFLQMVGIEAELEKVVVELKMAVAGMVLDAVGSHEVELGVALVLMVVVEVVVQVFEVVQVMVENLMVESFFLQKAVALVYLVEMVVDALVDSEFEEVESTNQEVEFLVVVDQVSVEVVLEYLVVDLVILEFLVFVVVQGFEVDLVVALLLGGIQALVVVQELMAFQVMAVVQGHLVEAYLVQLVFLVYQEHLEVAQESLVDLVEVSAVTENLEFQVVVAEEVVPALEVARMENQGFVVVLEHLVVDLELLEPEVVLGFQV
jgi:hypothetical protein